MHALFAADREGTERRRAAPDFRSVGGLCPPHLGNKEAGRPSAGGLRAALWASWLGEATQQPLTAWHRGEVPCSQIMSPWRFRRIIVLRELGYEAQAHTRGLPRQ